MDETVFFNSLLSAKSTLDLGPLIDELEDDASFAFLGRDAGISTFGMVSASVVSGLIELLSDERITSQQGFSSVVMYVQSEWQRIDEQDKRRLLPALIAAYPSLKDVSSWLQVSELLGEYYADDHALEGFISLQRTTSDMSRVLLPIGVAKLVVHCEEPDLRRKAESLLNSFLSDPFELVVEEAQDALASLPGRLRAVRRKRLPFT